MKILYNKITPKGDCMKPHKTFDIKKQEKNIAIIFILAIVLYSGFVFFGDIHKIINASLNFNWFVVPVVLFFTLINYFFRHLRFYLLLNKICVVMGYK
jgi:uncharacterized membrane protein YbhN (UPF0104 family)